MRRSKILMALLLSLLFLCIPARGETPQDTVEDVRMTKPGSFSCTFDGMKRSFVLDLPADCGGAPLVMMLPGYGNTAEAFRNEVHFERQANALGYAVAYVTGAPDPNDPVSSVGWHSDRGTEGNRDLEFLTALAAYLQETYLLDSAHTCVAGFSNGAFMVHRLAVEAGGTFSAFVSVAGSMPASVWETRRESSALSFFQITGEKDDVVPKNRDGSARYSKAPAIEDVMAYWAGSGGLLLQETETIGGGSVLTKYTAAGTSRQVWDLSVANGRHSWPSVRFNGIDTNACILAFLEAQK